MFSPKSCVLVGASLFSIGGVLSSQATVLRTFLLGRAVSGLGGAGIMVTSFTLVLNYTSKKRRGLYFGLLNSALTTGVSLGAVLAGALLPIIGWVSSRHILAGKGKLTGSRDTFSWHKVSLASPRDHQGDSPAHQALTFVHLSPPETLARWFNVSRAISNSCRTTFVARWYCYIFQHSECSKEGNRHTNNVEAGKD